MDFDVLIMTNLNVFLWWIWTSYCDGLERLIVMDCERLIVMYLNVIFW